MSFLQSKIPSDITPGSHQATRFQGFFLSHWKKVKLENLLSVIQESAPGTDGLEKVREIAARRAGEGIYTNINMRSQISLVERVSAVRAGVTDILLCRPFLPPSIFSKVRDFVNENTSNGDREGELQKILDEQKKYQKLISRYGNVVSLRKSVNLERAIQDFLLILRELSTEECPRRLIELLENSETAEVTWRHIGSTYKALNREDAGVGNTKKVA